MAHSNAIRNLAITHYKNGKTAQQIRAITLVNIDTIRRWIREFKRDGKVLSEAPPGRTPIVTNKTNMREVKRLIRNNSQRSIGKLLPRPTSYRTVWRMVQKLKLKVIS